MGLIANIVPNKASGIWIWKIIEEEKQLGLGLPDDILTAAGQFKAESRRKEWLAVRQILQIAAGKTELIYDPSGKPSLPGLYLSVSHTTGYSGVYLSTEYQGGLDLEAISPRILKIAERFLNEQEKKRFSTDDIQLLTLLWSTKEALFKKHGGETTNFALNQDILSVDQKTQEIKAVVKMNNNTIEESLAFQIYEEVVMVYTQNKTS